MVLLPIFNLKLYEMNTLTQSIVVMIVCFISISAAAQQDISSSEREMMKDKFAADVERLDLTEEQKDDYLEISRRYGEQLKALRNSTAGRMQKYGELKSIRKNKDSEMKELLSKDQFKIYKDIQEERQAEMKARRKGGRM